MSSPLADAAADARTLERDARARARTPQGAAAALALALGKLCADEGLDVGELEHVTRAAHAATRARKHDA